MMKAAGARERHIARCRYQPTEEAEREVRGAQTFKRKGDIVMSARMSVEVRQDGWY